MTQLSTPPTPKQLEANILTMAKTQGYKLTRDMLKSIMAKLSKLETKKKAKSSQFEPIKLSAKAAKRYDKIADEIRQGKNLSSEFNSVEEAMNYLHNC